MLPLGVLCVSVVRCVPLPPDGLGILPENSGSRILPTVPRRPYRGLGRRGLTAEVAEYAGYTSSESVQNYPLCPSASSVVKLFLCGRLAAGWSG